MDELEIRKYWAKHLPDVDIDEGNPQATYKRKLSLHKASDGAADYPQEGVKTVQLVNGGQELCDSGEFDPQVMNTVQLTPEESLELASSPANDMPRLADCSVIDKLGEGGMGVVYRGWQDNLCREVAVKKSLCLLYTSPSPRDKRQSRMPSSA